MNSLANKQKLTLIGGGHSHIEVIRRLGKTRAANLDIHLISREPLATYSGMLPGYLAGFYQQEEIQIDLERLCQKYGVQFTCAEVSNLDPNQQTVTAISNHQTQTFNYDLLSLNLGGAPSLNTLANSSTKADWIIPVKPIQPFVAYWQDLKEAAVYRKGQMRIAVVGGGAGGIELVMAAQAGLDNWLATKNISARPSFHLLTAGPELLDGQFPKASQWLNDALRQKNIQVHTGYRVESTENEQLISTEGTALAFDTVLWTTQVVAPKWLKETGLALDEKGFIQINEQLESVSHPNIFAVGDTASLIDQTLPKSGVVAVRQGPILANNLAARAKNQNLNVYKPQNAWLVIVGTGQKNAVAYRGDWCLSGRWVWRWKQWLDQRFMRRYQV